METGQIAGRNAWKYAEIRRHGRAMQGFGIAQGGTGGSQSHDLPTGRYLLTVSLQGYPVVNRFSGRLEGDVIRRTVEVSGGNSQPLRREWEAQRVK
ncbi:MAG TPA: hypothetical protein VFC28_10265 [Opitutaceae bacterium]|jgi:hypothetical protein|nr:hypothetical protein [Opitutaceae bacterium]